MCQKHEVRCENCRVRFQTGRPDRVFCSTDCRDEWQRDVLGKDMPPSIGERLTLGFSLLGGMDLDDIHQEEVLEMSGCRKF